MILFIDISNEEGFGSLGVRDEGVRYPKIDVKGVVKFADRKTFNDDK